ncbi:hypothetical protein GCG21_11955 [Pseudactinotalea sp. HY160]|uniref:hypothetical protein n=1 Tax=Pseudactinotalea sp. HY160 TaxID=2654490 RepID=UPI00130F9BD6|nr:hypothetical protein [Pseudactinotalea sp. HY160]MPV50706.1 hypothetical protein [Pseudactinotalea sp. HY160]
MDLVQNAMDAIRETDSTSDRMTSGLVAHRAVVGTPTKFGAWSSIVSFCDEGASAIREWQSRGRSYRTLYSRAHFIASHFLAASFKLEHPHVHWEAEFSDPLSRNALGVPRNSRVEAGPLLDSLREGIQGCGGTPPGSDNTYTWGEYATLALADRLVFMNDAQRDLVLGLYPAEDPVIVRARQRSTIAPHPSPPPELYEEVVSDYPLERSHVNIGYFGNFYSSQRPATLFGACAALPAADRDRVRLHVFTDAVEEVRRQARSAGDTVRVSRRLPYLEFLSLASRMDVLLAMDAATPPGQERNPVLLSKWSDYKGSGTPVWGVVEAGSLLDAQPLAHRSTLGHLTAALQVLIALSRSRAG